MGDDHDALQLLTLSDGRTLEALSIGPDEAPAVVFHFGTPQGIVDLPPLSAAVRANGMRLVTWSRPGYGHSTPKPGRSVADVAADATEVLDALGVERFVNIGWSGGGPHALACSALLGERCRATASIASVAPWDAEGLDVMAGMGEENIQEFGLAEKGEAELTPWLEAVAAVMEGVAGADVAASLGDLIPPVDEAALTGEFADAMACSLRRAVIHGATGWRDDDLAFVKPWGFDLAATGPVAVWQGDQDRMVPFAHGVWLTEHLPHAEPHLLEGEGHLSVAVGAIDDIVRGLSARR
jgi:pimeloyl-ACP methyl ester carboxylesterase